MRQLRHLIQCPTRNEEFVYATDGDVSSYDTETRQTTSLLPDLTFKPTTIAAAFGFVAAGGQRGVLVVRKLGSDEPPVHIKNGRNCINGLCIFNHQGQPRLLTCSNDKTIKVHSLPQLDLLHTVEFSEPVNYAAVSPDGRRMVAVGDEEDAYLYDISASGEFMRTAAFKAGRDAGFSCAWDRTSQRFGVATQDNHVGVWDICDLEHPVAEFFTSNELRAFGNVPRSVKFSQTGPDLLLFSELFYSFFKTLVGKEVTVELKNDLEIRGTLVSVDQFLNIKLDDIGIVNETKYPHMMSVKNCFIRGSVVRYVSLPAQSVDTALLQDAARREAQAGR